jgi:DNA-3-methyladenine glycosylase II
VLPVVPPYRLDLTASVLRRYPSNAVDLFGADGCYRRAFAGPPSPLAVEVEQASPDSLVAIIDGPAAQNATVLATLRRMLGLDVDVAPFLRASRKISWLAPLARRMQGVRPPRYPNLWETCVNAVVFQQISLHAASAIMRRLVLSCSAPVVVGDVTLHAFPTPEAVGAAGPTTLKAAGLSASKIATLQRIADAGESGILDEAELERLPSGEAAARLATIKGVGPWTAALILLRGLGRLDVFPANDSGAARSLALLTGGKPVATDSVLETLGPQRGMLYYHLLLARLEARGDLPAPP